MPQPPFYGGQINQGEKPEGPKSIYDLMRAGEDQLRRLVGPHAYQATGKLAQIAGVLGPQADVADYNTNAQSALKSIGEGNFGQAVIDGGYAGLSGIGLSELAKAGAAMGAGIRAYHGSPHDFEKFSMDKIGTGEGAQAYGHGLYFAGNEEVAKTYRDALARPTMRRRIFRDIQERIDAGADEASARQSVADEYRERADTYERLGDPKAGEWRAKAELATSENLDALSDFKGRMYEVNINADPDDFLDWDAPFRELPEKHQRTLERIARERSGPVSDKVKSEADRLLEELDPPPDFAEGYDPYADVRGAGAYLGVDGAPEEVSRALFDAGIPGLKYLDQGSRYTPSNLPDNPIANEARGWLEKAGGDTQTALRLFQESNPIERFATLERDEVRKVIEAAGRDVTRNYVVFDDSLIEIVRKYGIAALVSSGVISATMADQLREQGYTDEPGA